MWQGRGESKSGSRLGQVNWTDFGALVARLSALANFLRRLWAKRGQVRPPLLGCSSPKQVGPMLLVSQGRRGSSSLPLPDFPKCLLAAGLPWPRPLVPVAPACRGSPALPRVPTARFPFGLCPAPRSFPIQPPGAPGCLTRAAGPGADCAAAPTGKATWRGPPGRWPAPGPAPRRGAAAALGEPWSGRA